MKRCIRTLLATILVVGLVSTAHSAPIYLDLSGISGDVTEKGYQKCIDVHSVQMSLSVAISTNPDGSRDTSDPSFSELSLTTTSNSSASPALWIHAIESTPIAEATVTVLTDLPGGITGPLVELEMTDVYISGYAASIGPDGGNESMSLNFAEMVYRYTLYDQFGNGTAFEEDWNVLTGSGGGTGFGFIASPSQPVPEPSTFSLAALGFLGLIGFVRRRKR